MSVETAASRFDSAKWIVVVALVAVAVVGNSYFSDQSLLYRVLGIVAIGAVAGLVALQTAKGAAFWVLVKGSRTEIRKVVWPPRISTTSSVGTSTSPKRSCILCRSIRSFRAAATFFS